MDLLFITNKYEIIVDSESHISDIIPFILGPVLSILLHQKGRLILHGSAVKIDNNAIAFIGNKENGKSTIAMALHKKGYPIITDDIIVIGFDNDNNPIIYPGFPYLRLSERLVKYLQNTIDYTSQFKSKYEKNFYKFPNGFSTKPIKLKRIYLIEKDKKASINIMRSSESVIELIRNSFTIKIFKDSDKILNLKDCSKIIRKISVYRLGLKHSFKELPKIATDIESDFKGYNQYKK